MPPQTRLPANSIPAPAKPPRVFSFALEAAAALALIFAVIYLFHTNSAAVHWSQGYNPTGLWQLSTLVAALPIVILLGAMAILRLKAHVAAIAGLVTALLAAIVVFHMPARLAFTAAAYGAGYGVFPICWIILPVIFLYDLTVKTGRFVTLQQSLTGITADSRLQLLLIAFALGAFFEGTSGFGTPVAVCSAILISLGFRPLQAAGLSLLANTAPVAFGAMGIPIVALHGVTGLDLFSLTRTTAVILVPFDLLVPFWLIWAFAGFSAMIEVWPAILAAGATFATHPIPHGHLHRPLARRHRRRRGHHRRPHRVPALLAATPHAQRRSRRHHRPGPPGPRPHRRNHLPMHGCPGWF